MRERIRRAIESRLMAAPQEYGLPLRKNLAGTGNSGWGITASSSKSREIVYVLGVRHGKNIYEYVTGRIK